MYQLENENLIVSIDEIGAELKSVFSKKKQLEYIWPGKIGTFQKSAPNLFPFIGNIKNENVIYNYKGEKITLPMDKHGFIKDKVFTMVEQSESKIVFQLNSSEITKLQYPYDFTLKIIYELEGSNLKQIYEVENLDSETLFYHIGAHTAFNCMLKNDENIEDYSLYFDDKECVTYEMDKGGEYLSSKKHKITLENPFRLNKEKFRKNTFVLDDLKSRKVIWRNKEHGVELEFEDFPLITIWTNKDESNFICLEPWAGVTDFVENSGEAETKYLINRLDILEKKSFTQNMKFF